MLKKISLIAVVLLVLASSIYTINRVNKIEKHLAALTEQSAVDEEVVEKLEGISRAKHGYSGVRRYLGDELPRAKPSANAAYITGGKITAGNNPLVEVLRIVYDPSPNTDYITGSKMVAGNNPLVEVLRLVYDSSNTDDWALISSGGIIGYVRASDLADAEPYREYENVELDLKESLGGFYLGERIEKLIGTLDEGYSLIFEQSEVYLFEKLQALVTDSKKVHSIKTTSPEVKLGSDYKVTDLASEVISYYESKYNYLEDNDTGHNYGDIAFAISDNVVLAFSIDTKEVLPESVITEIRLHTLKPF